MIDEDNFNELIEFLSKMFTTKCGLDLNTEFNKISVDIWLSYRGHSIASCFSVNNNELRRSDFLNCLCIMSIIIEKMADDKAKLILELNSKISEITGDPDGLIKGSGSDYKNRIDTNIYELVRPSVFKEIQERGGLKWLYEAALARHQKDEMEFELRKSQAVSKKSKPNRL